MSHQRAGSTAIDVLAPVSTLAMAVAAAQAGARLVDAGAYEPLAGGIRQAGLDVLICGQFEQADFARDAVAAIRNGTGLICTGAAAAERAERQGMSRDRIIVQVAPGELAVPGELAAGAGWRFLVDVDGAAATEAAAEAVATVCAWQGAGVIRTRYVAQVRRCLDMTECILGTRPPALAVRGLA